MKKKINSDLKWKEYKRENCSKYRN